MKEKLEALEATLSEAGLDSQQLDSIKATISSISTEATELLNNVQASTAKFQDAVKTRDKAKEKLRTIISTIGLDEDYKEDDLKGVVAKLQSGKDVGIEELRKDMLDKMERQKLQYENQLTDFQGKVKDYERTVYDLAFSREVSQIMLNEKEIRPEAFRFVEVDLKRHPHKFDPETGTIVYLDKEGNPQLNTKGGTKTIHDVFNDLKEKGEFDLLRPASANGSGKTSKTSSVMNDPNATAQDLLRVGLEKLKKGGG